MRRVVIIMLIIFCMLVITARAGEIHRLASSGDIEGLVKYLQINPGHLDGGDKFLRTPLHMAVFHGRRQVAEFLIKKGAQVSLKDKYGFTPLDFAAIKGRHEFVELLVNSGAAKGEPGKSNGATARLLPVMETDTQLLDLMISRGDELNDILDKGKNSLYSALMELKEKVSAQDELSRVVKRVKQDKRTLPIHLAAISGDLDMIKMLIKHNPALVHAGDERDISPLHYAAVNGHTHVTAYLVKKGADVNSRTNIGLTPLYGAASAGKTETVRLLISLGANVNGSAEEGAVPLHATVNAQIAGLLIKHGARLEAVNICGFTPLHTSSHFGHRDVVSFLVNKGADIEAKTMYGWTPLMEAVYGNKKDIVSFLIARGADVNARNQSGSSPLKIAHTLERFEIAELLLKHGARE